MSSSQENQVKGEGGAEAERPGEDVTAPQAPRAPYEPPCLLRKRSMARVTLFSGSGAGFTSS